MSGIKVTIEFVGDESDAEEVVDLLRFIVDEIKDKRKTNYEEEESDERGKTLDGVTVRE